MARIVVAAIERACKGHPYETEAVLIWKERTRYGEIWCRAQLDVWCRGLCLILDPKILRIAANPESFGRAAMDSGYDVQGVFYPRGVTQLFPDLEEPVRFANLVVENYPPYGVRSLYPGRTLHSVAERQVVRAMELWAKCLHENDWPGYPRGIQELDATMTWPSVFPEQDCEHMSDTSNRRWSRQMRSGCRRAPPRSGWRSTPPSRR